MNTYIRTLNQGILFGIVLFLVISTISFAASMNFPTVAPPGTNIVSDGSFFTNYFSKILVNPDVSTTDGTVKNTVKTEQIATTKINSLAKWSGDKLVDSAVFNTSNGRIEVEGGIHIGNPGPNQILVNVGGGDMVWKSQSEVLKRCRMPFPSSLNLSHVTPRIGTPDSWNQDYVKDAPNCGYTCKPGWIGDDCNTREELPTCGNTPNTCAFTGITKNFSYGSCGGQQTWTCYNQDGYGGDKQCSIQREGCLINGGWSDWSFRYDDGNTSCGGYKISYYSRSCNNPAPENGGTDCVGPNTKSSSSYNGDCYVPSCYRCGDLQCGGDFGCIEGNGTECIAWGQQPYYSCGDLLCCS